MSEKHVDDEWKKKAEEEKAHLEEELEAARGREEASREPPPVTFEGLVASFAIQAAIALGEARDPSAGEAPRVDLPAARYVIDTLALLAEKTKGNLEHREDLALRNLITELRFRYVQAAQPGGTPAA